MRKHQKTSLLGFVAFCAIAPLVVRPVTVVEITAASGAEVQVHGWTQMDETGPRVALEPQSPPIRLLFRGADVRARFITQSEDQTLRVEAVQKRAWIPMVRVGSLGSRIDLEGRGSFMGMKVE